MANTPSALTVDLLPATMPPQLATLADGTTVWMQLYIDAASGIVKGRIVPPPPG